jgi:co-chaperonin GroES (HSP10)
VNIRLIGDRIIVRPIPREKIGVIELPESLKDDNNVGGPKVYWVMATGPGRRNKKGIRIPTEVEYGDRVICHSYTKGIEDVNLPNGDVIITADQILLALPKATPA